MYNSGYIIVDMGGFDLSSSSSVTIPGIWERVNEAISTGKPIFFGNCTTNGGENAVAPICAPVVKPTTDYIECYIMNTLCVSFNDFDSVTVIEN